MDIGDRWAIVQRVAKESDTISQLKKQQIILRPQCLLGLSRMKRFLNLRHNIKTINFKVRGRKLSFSEKPVPIRYYG